MTKASRGAVNSQRLSGVIDVSSAEAEIGGRLLGGRAVIALALRNALAGLQRRRMAKLAEIADRGADVEHALLADEAVAADLDRAGVDAIAEGGIARHEGAARNDRIVADPEKVRGDRHGVRSR